ncbi:MAG: DNA repair protein RecN [Spirochaetales bacterium]
MLQSLKINSIALIDDLTINFKDKLNVLTGETGAGKSIIIDSLNFLLGARADKTLIRSGKDSAKVTGVFYVDVENPFVADFFEKADIPSEDTIIITREMNINGKSATKVNGEFVSAAMLRAFTTHLIDIHGQNEHQFLLDEKNQLQLLDDYGQNSIKPLKADYLISYDGLKEVNRQILSFGGNEEERLKEIDLLEFEVKEIEGAKLSENEENSLQEEFRRMQNIEKIANEVNLAYSNLNGGADGSGLSQSITFAERSLSAVEEYDEQIAKIAERLNSAKLELEDITSELGAYAEGLEFDEEEFERVDSRLDYIKKLKRKYGGSIESAGEYLEKAKTRLYALKNSAEQLEKLANAKNKLLKELFVKGSRLTEERKTIANTLSQEILEQLKELGMPSANLEVHFNNLPTLGELEQQLTSNGIDIVEFMFSANLGEPVKPLTKIISGGEMSRFMLALKTIIAKTDNIPTMIFDEIDSGISGKMAQAVSHKMAKISRNHQVLVVSHLPQISAMADTHFYIEKIVEGTKTLTNVKEITENAIINEIARMLSGEQLTEHSISNAKELKNICDEYKRKL